MVSFPSARAAATVESQPGGAAIWGAAEALDRAGAAGAPGAGAAQATSASSAAALNRAPALLHGVVLRVDTVDAGERLGLLHLAVDEPVVFPVPPLPEVGPLLAGRAPRGALNAVVFGQRRRVGPVVVMPVVDHAVLVV